MAREKKMDQVILGFLSHESLTGYEIKKQIDSVLKYFWNGSYGNIYPTLSALEEQGAVTKEEAIVKGRNKITYTITDKGRTMLKVWLDEPECKDELRYETLLKLFFGSVGGSNNAIEHINSFEDKIKEELPKMERSVEVLKGILNEDAHRYYLVTAMFGEIVYKAYLQWCEEAKKVLKEDNK